MKLMSRVTLIAGYACALAFGAGCSSADSSEPANDDTASTLTEGLRRPHGRRPRPPADINPCAAVLCITGTTCEVVDGDAVCTPNEPPPSAGQFCGGFAGIECPGAGACLDDPSDDCDPERGGADCGGLCECSGALVLCIAGTVFDESPDVCACVAQEPEVDACAAVRCAAGTHCEVEGDQAACVEDEPTGGDDAPFCGGIAAFECPGSGNCIDDASDDCDPERGGADCGGICQCGPIQVLCIQGFVFDSSASVCACVPAEENPCNLADCQPNTVCEVQNGEAVCVPNEPNPCAAVLCARGTECVVRGDEARCVPQRHDDSCNESHRR